MNLRGGDFACLIILTVVVACIASCQRGDDGSDPENSKLPAGKETTDVQQLVSSEEMILNLTKALKPLNHSAMNLKLPSGRGESLFGSEVELVDIAPSWNEEKVNEYILRRQWELDTGTSRDIREGFWEGLIGQVEYFDFAKFYFIDGHFVDERKRFQSNMGFAANAVMKDGKAATISGHIKVTWDWANLRKTDMQITRWETQDLECVLTAGLLFREEREQRLNDPEIADQLGMSMHDELNRLLIQGKKLARRKNDPYPFFFSEVTLEHPAVSVVDLNKDGFDDFFVVRPFAKSLFFQNDGTGRFDEIGEEIGLDLDPGCVCSLFADFDNDGDQDVFVGRARERALYLENENGTFADRTSTRVKTRMPYMVSSISAADFNGDGLLDVYFSTYSPIEGSHARAGKSKNWWPSLYLSEDEEAEFKLRMKSAHPFLDMVGPPNLLLENTGGAFEVASHQPQVASWRKTFQSSWSDFDLDGDPDLYVCNDFAADDFYRNDGSGGFVRINDEVGLNQLGYGMGVAWGDHNQDGQVDLYISNMYSKAGKRITGQISNIDPRFKQIAKGNFLLDQVDGKFELVSLDGGSQKTVAKAGWAWGGQFCDVDNDGQLEIFVPNGFYTAPPELAEDIDL